MEEKSFPRNWYKNAFKTCPPTFKSDVIETGGLNGLITSTDGIALRNEASFPTPTIRSLGSLTSATSGMSEINAFVLTLRTIRQLGEIRM